MPRLSLHGRLRFGCPCVSISGACATRTPMASPCCCAVAGRSEVGWMMARPCTVGPARISRHDVSRCHAGIGKGVEPCAVVMPRQAIPGHGRIQRAGRVSSQSLDPPGGGLLIALLDQLPCSFWGHRGVFDRARRWVYRAADWPARDPARQTGIPSGIDRRGQACVEPPEDSVAIACARLGACPAPWFGPARSLS